MLAAVHFAAARTTGLQANEVGFHAVALGVARQAMESLTIIEIGFLPAVDANRALSRWQSERDSQGELRKQLSRGLWPHLPPTPWGLTWGDHMTSLAKSLQPYAHFSPSLLQWNLSMVRANVAAAAAIASIGDGSFDPDKAERIALLFGVLLWNMLVTLDYVDDLDAHLITIKRELDDALAATQWLDAGEPWADQLLPHVWFR